MLATLEGQGVRFTVFFTSEDVVAESAKERIATVTTGDRIAAMARFDDVLAFATGEHITTLAAHDHVVAITTIKEFFDWLSMPEPLPL